VRAIADHFQGGSNSSVFPTNGLLQADQRHLWNEWDRDAEKAPQPDRQGARMTRWWWLVGFNVLTSLAFAVLALALFPFVGGKFFLSWWKLALVFPTSFPLVPLTLLVNPRPDSFALLLVNPFLWATAVEWGLRTFFDRAKDSDAES